jgi:hypothetical protein
VQYTKMMAVGGELGAGTSLCGTVLEFSVPGRRFVTICNNLLTIKAVVPTGRNNRARVFNAGLLATF